MRWHETFIPTIREVPREAEAASHIWMLRGGYIRRLSAGVYSYLPLGYRVLTKICQIIREEMGKAGAEELLLPALHPSELWKKTGRYESLGEDKFSFKNRSGLEYVLGPTHEEVVTEILAASVRSHKEFPKILYQIQTKFRDEARPRFGVIRSKEFLMKDAYSFDKDEEGLERSYQKMYEAYGRIFSRAGLPIEVVTADPGMMGGNVSHEFMVPCNFGEDWMARCSRCKVTASALIFARAPKETKKTQEPERPLEIFETPSLKSIQEITQNFGFQKEELVKTILYLTEGEPVAALVRGDHEVNETKLRRLCGVEKLVPASPEEILRITKAPLGFTGPVGLRGTRMIADYDLQGMKNFVVGANQNDRHLKNVNLERDFKPHLFGDIRSVRTGDLCADCRSPLELLTAMEVGHIFKLGSRYSLPLKAFYLDEKGKKRPVVMGCYGIGVGRIMAAHIEVHHDERGILWEKALAPYHVHLINLNATEPEPRQMADALYDQLLENEIEVLYDNRDERTGVKFHDADLLGIPLQAVVSVRNAKKGKIELQTRRQKQPWLVNGEKAVPEIERALAELS